MHRPLRSALVALFVALLVHCERIPERSPQVPAATATQPTATEPLRIQGDVKPPVVIQKVDPTYPAALKNQKRKAGLIVLECVVTKSGTVRDLN
jgi:hypothetical protein